MEYSKHKILIDLEEFNMLVEARNSFDLLHASYEELKKENNDMALEVSIVRLESVKRIEALETIRLCAVSRKQLNNKAIEKICQEGLEGKV